MSSEADATLLHDAEVATAGHSLPPDLAGVRRTHLMAYDPLSTTWAGWDLTTGTPAWLRVLRPQWQGHPGMDRRFVSGLSPIAGLRVWTSGRAHGLPFFRLSAPGVPLRMLLPEGADPPFSLPERAIWFARGIDGLLVLHRHGRGLAGPIADQLTLGTDGPRLVDLDAFAKTVDPLHDLADLARTLLSLAPDAHDPLSALAHAWSTTPPPSIDDAAVLLQRAMAVHLVGLRHGLARSRRADTRRNRIGRLSRLVARLTLTSSPPTGRACVAVLPDDSLLMVDASPDRLVAGPVARPDVPPPHLVWSAASGIDPNAVRLVLRAWASRPPEREPARLAVQQQLGAAAVDPSWVVQWLSAARRLRSARLLLDAEHRIHLVR